MNSPAINERNWALKCATSISLLYQQVALDTFDELSSQFFQNQNTMIWVTAIDGICLLISTYGLAYFEPDPDTQSDSGERHRANSETSQDDGTPERNSK